MLKKGTMRPVKKGIGFALLAAGIGLIAMPDKTAEILCNYKIIFGIVAAAGGWLLAISGRQA